jgi:hypothetical protein
MTIQILEAVLSKQIIQHQITPKKQPILARSRVKFPLPKQLVVKEKKKLIND